MEFCLSGAPKKELFCEVCKEKRLHKRITKLRLYNHRLDRVLNVKKLWKCTSCGKTIDVDLAVIYKNEGGKQMELTPEEKRRIYEEEKARLEAQDKIKKEKDWGRRPLGLKGVLIVLFVFFGFVGSCVYILTSGKKAGETARKEYLTVIEKLDPSARMLLILGNPNLITKEQIQRARYLEAIQNVGRAGPLTFEIKGGQISDTPIKTQITLDLLISGKVTDSNIRALLNNAYSKTQSPGGFEYHTIPTHVFLYALTTRNQPRHEWVAMLQRIGGGSTPEVKVRRVR